MLPVEHPFKVYTGIDGRPLNNGYVYFGEPDQNPITHPVTVFWDAEGLIPAAQPLRTLNGYIMRGGTPANVFYDGAYSELVQDRHQQQVFYARNSDEFSIASYVTGLAKEAGASLIGFLQQGFGAVKVTVEAALRDRVSALHFGAKGDGVTDDTLALQRADAAASARGKTLFIPAGTYMVEPLNATTSWQGEAGTVFKYRGSGNVDLITAEGVDGITMADFTVDGSVSADPGTWSSSNYDTFGGASGLSVNNCTGAKIVRIRGQNTWKHAVRTINTKDATVDTCYSDRSRGNFGDGFFFVDSIGIKVINCHAYDFTRIGFVFDTFGDSPKTSHGLQFVGCTAEYGHHGSILYGGGEYNAGAWFENCAQVQISDFHAKNIDKAVGRGLMLTTGIKNNGVTGNVAYFSATNLLFEDTGFGLVGASLGGYPIAVTISNIQAIKVFQGLSFQAKHQDDSFSCSDGNVNVDFLLNPTVTIAYAFDVAAGLPSKPVISLSNCVVAHTNQNLTSLANYGVSSSCADVGAFLGNTGVGGVRIIIDNLRNVTGEAAWIGIPTNNECDLVVSRSYIRIAYAPNLGNGSARFDNCRIHSAQVGNGSSALTEFRGCTFEGQVRAGGNSVRIEGGKAKLAGTDQLWLFSPSTGYGPAVTVSGTYFEKDIATGGAPLRIGFGSVAFSAVMSELLFYNTTGGSTGNPCVLYANGLRMHFGGVLKDATVLNVADIDSGGSPVPTDPGVTDIALH